MARFEASDPLVVDQNRMRQPTDRHRSGDLVAGHVHNRHVVALGICHIHRLLVGTERNRPGIASHRHVVPDRSRAGVHKREGVRQAQGDDNGRPVFGGRHADRGDTVRRDPRWPQANAGRHPLRCAVDDQDLRGPPV